MARRVRTVVGYGHSAETGPDTGVWKDLITAKYYRGEVLRNPRSLTSDDRVVGDISMAGVSLSLLADPYARQNFIFMKYVKWNGILWTVANVVEEYPRLILRLGGVYNGETAPPAPAPPSGDSG